MVIWFSYNVLSLVIPMTIQENFPENPITALDEVQSLLGFRRCELISFLEALCKAEDAFIGYSFGDLSIHFTINQWTPGGITSLEEVNESEKKCDKSPFHLSLELKKGNTLKSISYRYNLEDLKKFKNVKQLRIESFGAR